MGQQVSIDSIVTTRTLEPGDDIKPLAHSIRDTGLKIPVLVNQNNELIDGLRRIHAVRSLGNTRIEVVAVALYDPAITWLERARVHGVEVRPLSPRRIWEIYQACRPLIAVTRSHEMRGKNHGRGVHINGREKFLKATGIESESYFQAATQLFRMTKEDGLRGQLAQEAIELVEKEQLSVYMALEYVRTRRRPGVVVKADEQLTLLTNSASALSGISYSLQQLGPIDASITADQLKGIARELREFRRAIHQLIHQLEREQGSR